MDINKRILVWVGSRSNYGRLSKLIDILLKEYRVSLILGDYDLPYINKLGNNPKIIGKIPNLLYKDTRNNMSRSLSLVVQGVATIIEPRKPFDLAIVHGDRFENLGFAIACSYDGIPLLHTEGGEVSGQIDDKIRNAITALSDFHCAATDLSANRLCISGYNAFNTGSPAIDYASEAEWSTSTDPFILCLFNPSDDDDRFEFARAIKHISSWMKVVWVNPNNDPGWKDIARLIHLVPNISIEKGLTPLEYYSLLKSCKFLIGNTSSGIKEGASFGVPYLMVGTRQFGREVCANVTRCHCIKDDIIKIASDFIYAPFHRYKYDGRFGTGNASSEIAKVIREEVSA